MNDVDDNCFNITNPGQLDSDGDGQGAIKKFKASQTSHLDLQTRKNINYY